MDEPAQLVSLTFERDARLSKAIVHDGRAVEGVASRAEQMDEPSAKHVGCGPPDSRAVFGFEAPGTREDEGPPSDDLAEAIGASLEGIRPFGLGDDEAEAANVEAVEEVGEPKRPPALGEAYENPPAVRAEAGAAKFVIRGLDDLVDLEDGAREDVEGDAVLDEETPEGFDTGVAGVEGLGKPGLDRWAADEGLGAGGDGEVGQGDGLAGLASAKRGEEICKEVHHGPRRLPGRGQAVVSALNSAAARGYSSAGRAPGSHPGGQRFEPA